MTCHPSYQAVYRTPIGNLLIKSANDAIQGVCLCKEIHISQNPSSLTDQAANQLLEYFSGNRKNFTLPLAPQGTEFQQKVWQALTTIPYGETKSYKQIALQINCPKAYRAVGFANHKNPILILIPCHRVIGANASLTGFAAGISLKKRLLELEAFNR